MEIFIAQQEEKFKKEEEERKVQKEEDKPEAKPVNNNDLQVFVPDLDNTESNLAIQFIEFILKNRPS